MTRIATFLGICAIPLIPAYAVMGFLKLIGVM